MQLLVLYCCFTHIFTLEVHEVHVVIEFAHLLVNFCDFLRHLRLMLPTLMNRRFTPLLVVFVLSP